MLKGMCVCLLQIILICLLIVTAFSQADLEPSTPQEYVLKGVVNACMGQHLGSRYLHSYLTLLSLESLLSLELSYLEALQSPSPCLNASVLPVTCLLAGNTSKSRSSCSSWWGPLPVNATPSRAASAWLRASTS